MNVYPTDKPVLSIPRVRIKSQTRSYDGSNTEESYIPTATKLVRAGAMTVNAAAGANTNVYTALGLTLDTMKMNRRYTLMTSLQVQEGGSGAALHDLAINLRPDNRNQIAQEVNFQDSGGGDVVAQVTSHINYEKGDISLQVLFTGGTAGYTFTANFGVFTLRFVPVATMNGRTKVTIETEMTDITIDPNEDELLYNHLVLQ